METTKEFAGRGSQVPPQLKGPTVVTSPWGQVGRIVDRTEARPDRLRF
jgi:hypothetical protein